MASALGWRAAPPEVEDPLGISGGGSGYQVAMPDDTDRDPSGTFAAETRGDETVVEEFRVGTAVVGVTDLRLLVRQNGSVRAVDLTNVRQVHRRTLENRRRLLAAIQWGLLGAFLLAAWRYAPLGALVAPVEQPPGAGFDQFYAAVNTLVDALRYLDEAFLLVAILSIGWAARQVVGYGLGRDRVLEVTVAGADPVHLPVPDDTTVTDRLRGAVSVRTDAENV